MRRVLCLLPAVAVLVLPTASGAAWSSSASGAASIGAMTMTNASGFTATCASVNNKNKGVLLSWSVSPDMFVEHYDIVRTGAGGGTDATFRVARTATTLTDTPPNTTGATYTYTIRAGSTQMTWTTAALPAIGTPTYTESKCLTG